MTGFLLGALAVLTSMLPQCVISDRITDVSKLTVTYVDEIVAPKTYQELQKIIKETDNKVAVAGGRYSQGGQIAYPDGLVVDMSNLNTILSFDKKNKRITVQAGANWRKVQEYIDPYNLSILSMQSYNDFSIGGALSVNVHGRDMQFGQTVQALESIKIMLADGSIVTASRKENGDLFSAAIGGYGAVGIILEATIKLTENIKLERKAVWLPLEDYPEYFFKNVHDNKNIVFHNANAYPDAYNRVLSVNFVKTNKPLTITDRMQRVKKVYPKELIGTQLVRRLPFLKKIRSKVDMHTHMKPDVMWRNYEMSYTVKMLEPLVRFPTTTVLQEYFVPIDHLLPFMQRLKETAHKYKINMINVSIRHVPQNNTSMLTYAPVESFAFVLYINMANTGTGKAIAKRWTRELIDHAISFGGTFYLPYQLYATKEQVRKAYPHFEEFLQVKKKYDPEGKFSNNLFKTYV